MECLHSPNTINVSHVTDEVSAENDELCVMSLNNQDTTISLKTQVIECSFFLG